MRRLASFTFIVVVVCLIAQALSLALHPKTTASAPAVLSPQAKYGSREVGSEPSEGITVTTTLRIFLLLGIDRALDIHTLALPQITSGGAGRPMSRSAWQASPYYRAGLHFDHWSKTVAAWEARRYDAVVDRRFDAAWHPRAAFWGYWLGRLLFLWFGLGMLGALGILLVLKRIHDARP